MVKGYIDHSTLGRVIVTVNPRARRFTARWKGVQLHLTVPAGVNVASTTRALDTMAVKLLASKPSPYDIEPGRRIDFDYFFIVFGRSAVPDEVRSRLVHDESGSARSGDSDRGARSTRRIEGWRSSLPSICAMQRASLLLTCSMRRLPCRRGRVWLLQDGR